MTIIQRAQDILISSLFGVVLGVILSLWASVFDHLYLENATKEFLYNLFVIYSLGLAMVFIVILLYVRRLDRQGKNC